MKKYILALDEGTTSARSIIFDRDLNIVNLSQHEFAQISIGSCSTQPGCG